MKLIHLYFALCVFLLFSACSQKTIPTPTNSPQPTNTPHKIETPKTTPTQKPIGPIKINADPENGFYWSYFLYVPSEIKGKYILVLPNNSGSRNDDITFHEGSARKVEVNGRIEWANKLGIPMIVPIFPRPDNETDGTIASQYLGRGTLESFWCKKYPDLCRQDLQLIAMIDDARNRLIDMGIDVEKEIFIWGYSASGMFTSRFVILHPDRVEAAAFGGHGWTTAPIDNREGVFLLFPYGIGDLEDLTDQVFDLNAFCNVSIFSYMGELDDNGWAMPWYIGNKHNISGIYNSIISKFGNTSTDLINTAKTIFDSVGCTKTFKIYPNTGHQISTESETDVLNFFKQNSD